MDWLSLVNCEYRINCQWNNKLPEIFSFSYMLRRLSSQYSWVFGVYKPCAARVSCNSADDLDRLNNGRRNTCGRTKQGNKETSLWGIFGGAVWTMLCENITDTWTRMPMRAVSRFLRSVKYSGGGWYLKHTGEQSASPSTKTDTFGSISVNLKVTERNKV